MVYSSMCMICNSVEEYEMLGVGYGTTQHSTSSSRIHTEEKCSTSSSQKYARYSIHEGKNILESKEHSSSRKKRNSS